MKVIEETRRLEETYRGFFFSHHGELGTPNLRIYARDSREWRRTLIRRRESGDYLVDRHDANYKRMSRLRLSLVSSPATIYVFQLIYYTYIVFLTNCSFFIKQAEIVSAHPTVGRNDRSFCIYNFRLAFVRARRRCGFEYTFHPAPFWIYKGY